MTTESTCPSQAEGKDAALDPVRAQYKEGRELLKKGDLSAAAMALHNALVGFEEQGDRQGVANAADRLADACLAARQYELALRHYLRARDICAGMEDPFSLLSLDRKLTGVYHKLGRHEEALACCSRMLDHYSDTKNPQGMVQTLETMAVLYRDAGQQGRAADSYRTIASIHKNFKHDRTARRFVELAEQMEQEQ